MKPHFEVVTRSQNRYIAVAKKYNASQRNEERSVSGEGGVEPVCSD